MFRPDREPCPASVLEGSWTPGRTDIPLELEIWWRLGLGFRAEFGLAKIKEIQGSNHPPIPVAELDKVLDRGETFISYKYACGSYTHNQRQSTLILKQHMDCCTSRTRA